MDNVYMVTVVVTDWPGMDTDRRTGVGKLTATRDVVITVTNEQEDGKDNLVIRPAQVRG